MYKIARQTYHAGPWQYVADLAADWEARLEAYNFCRDDETGEPTDYTRGACRVEGIDPDGSAADAMLVQWTDALDAQDEPPYEFDEFTASTIADAIGGSVVKP